MRVVVIRIREEKRFPTMRDQLGEDRDTGRAEAGLFRACAFHCPKPLVFAEPLGREAKACHDSVSSFPINGLAFGLRFLLGKA